MVHSLNLMLRSCLILLLALSLCAATGSPVAAGKRTPQDTTATAKEVKADVDGFFLAGGQYRKSGFEDFPKNSTPFSAWQRIDSSRLRGDEVLISRGGLRIWKTLYCARNGNIYLEMALMGREGEKYPFAWMACGLHCGEGGMCGGDTPLFIDITGDGHPDVRFESVRGIIKIKRSLFRNTRVSFQVDIIPSWLKRILGPNFRWASTISPSASVSAERDNPLEISRAGGDAH